MIGIAPHKLNVCLSQFQVFLYKTELLTVRKQNTWSSTKGTDHSMNYVLGKSKLSIHFYVKISGHI